jgi:hypothetical protein
MVGQREERLRSPELGFHVGERDAVVGEDEEPVCLSSVDKLSSYLIDAAAEVRQVNPGDRSVGVLSLAHVED